MLSKLLIIDKRLELSTKYKKCLEAEQLSVVVCSKLKDAIVKLQELEPDLVIISDSIDEKLSDFCRKIRALTCNMRPTIVALSKSADAADRISIIESGADDFLSEPVNIEEFKARIKAHLRRDYELNLDNKTLLPNIKLVNKFLKRLVKTKENRAVLLMSVENLRDYINVYSEIAGDKIIQALVAITKSSLETGDFLGQLNDNNFLMITNKYSAEKIAQFLTYAFDTVVTKFYSEADARRGYVMLNGDNKAGMRANFVSILIGGIIDNFDSVNSVQELLEKLYYIKKLAKVPSGSNYLFERKKLVGENSVEKFLVNKKIYINEPDEAMSLLLRTSLELQGYDVTEELDVENSVQPAVIIIDNDEGKAGLDECRKIKENSNFVNTKVIITTTIHDKALVLDSGADLYLPKPYEITDLIKWIEYLCKKEI